MKFLETTSATPEDDSLDGFRMRMITNHRKHKPLPLPDDVNPENRNIYLEEMQRFNQANLARRLKRSTGARRLLNEGRCREKDGSDKKGVAEKDGSDKKGVAELTHPLRDLANYCRTINSNLARQLSPSTGPRKWELLGKKLLGKGKSGKTPTSKKLQLGNDKIIKSTDIKFLFKESGDDIYKELSTGILEAHVDRFLFLYTNNSVHVQIVILYEKINAVFCLVEDQCMLPRLQFSLDDNTLHDNIMVGTRRIKDIQFHWLSQTFGEAPLNFASRAQAALWGPHSIRHCPIEKLYMDSKFLGKLPYDDHVSTFYVTLYSLVRLGEEASIVARLDEIEIVNLAEYVPGKIEMTVILKDFYSDILRINSIPPPSLPVIKRRLDQGFVKFYENNIRQNWNEIVENIIKSPEDFIEKGGWDSYHLEQDAITLDYYSDSSHGEFSLDQPCDFFSGKK